MKLAYLLVLAPLALIARVAGLSPELVFLLSFLAVIPLASLIGDTVEPFGETLGLNALSAILAAWFLLYEPTTPAMGR